MDLESGAAEGTPTEAGEEALLRSGTLGPQTRARLEEWLHGGNFEVDRPAELGHRPAPLVPVAVDLYRTLLLAMTVALPIIFFPAQIAKSDVVLYGLILVEVVIVLGGVFRVLWRPTRAPHARFMQALREDVLAGGTVTEPADLGAIDGSFASSVGGRLLPMTTRAAEQLRRVPGPHLATFLPASGLVLLVSGRPGGGYRAEPEDPRRKPDSTVAAGALARAWGFDPAWTAANRQGRLGGGQWRVLLRSRFGTLADVAFRYAAFRLVWALFAAYSSRPSGSGTLALLIELLFAGALVGAPVGVMVKRILEIVRIVRRGDVKTIELVRNVVVRTSEIEPSCGVVFGEGSLKVLAPWSAARLDWSALSLRVYYVPGPNIVVGVDASEVPLDDGRVGSSH